MTRILPEQNKPREMMPRGFQFFGVGLLLVLAAAGAGAMQGAPVAGLDFPKPVPPPKPIESSIHALTNAPLKRVAPGVFQLGQVRLDKNRRSICFPGSVNMANGPLEYLLVTKWGKTHEGVLRTEVEPFQIHLAVLLINNGSARPRHPAVISGAAHDRSQANPGRPIAEPSPGTLPGDRVEISITWDAAGKRVHRAAGDLVFNLNDNAALTNALWIYNGSRVWDGRFMAQAVGSIVSLVTDPDAQVNSMASGHDNDRIWQVNTNVVPSVDTPVEITMTLEASAHQ